MTKEMSKRFSDRMEKPLKYEFLSLKRSAINPYIFTQIEFVKYNLCGYSIPGPDLTCQVRNGFFGHYCAYVYFPSHWKFASLSVAEMNQELGPIEICIVSKKIYGPDGTDIQGRTCIGWNYRYRENPTEVDTAKISIDIQEVTKKIDEWEWVHESEWMLKSSIKQLVSSLKWIRTGKVILEKEDVEYEEAFMALIQKYKILFEFDRFKNDLK